MADLRLGLVLILMAALVYGTDELTKFQNNLKKLSVHFNNTNEKIDISNQYLDLICMRDFSARNVSELCLSQMEIVCSNAELLARMADAWSKYPYAGMLTATRQDWGAFDQCIGIDHQPEEGPRVLGKQCTMGLAIPVDLSFEDFYLLSYCMPEACSASDVASLITIFPIPEAVVRNLVNDALCATKESNSTMDASAIVVATLFCLIFGFVVLSTAYEVFLFRRQIKNRRPILTAFSVFTNGQKLTQTTQGNGTGDQILVFHGIKVISMMWILAGHNAGGFSVLPVTNSKEMEEFQSQRYSQYLLSAHLAVDTFFFLSGFLLAYQYFKGAANKPIIVQIKSVPHMIIHRYLRITPVVLMFFLFSMYLNKYIGDGPFFNAVQDSMHKPCKENWWAVFLYIQNYYNPDDLCWVHLWYLSADWQLFLFAPLIIIPMAWQYRRHFNFVMLGMVVLNILFVLVALYVKLRHPDSDPNNLEYGTHFKLVTYFMGVMFGFYFRCKKDKPYLFGNDFNLFMWFFAIAMLFGSTFVLHEISINDHTLTAQALCEVLIKPVWCLGLTFVVYSCTKGYGGVVTWFLAGEWMQVISKLTFCMYILHVPVIMFWISIRRTRDYFSDFNLFFYWCGHLIISLIVSTIWTLMFESPLITIERVLLGGGGRKPRPAKDELPKEKITITFKKPIENGDV